MILNEIQCHESLINNIEQLRAERNYSQDKMASEIDMSPRSYRRLINDEMNLHASFVILSLELKWNVDLPWLMGIRDERFDVARRVRQLPLEQIRIINSILDIIEANKK